MPGWTGCDVCQKVAKLVPVAMVLVGVGWLVLRPRRTVVEPDLNPWPIP